jgi:hypothetical protein
MDLKDVAFDCVDWINLAQEEKQSISLINTVINLLVP